MSGRLQNLDDPDYPAYTTGRAAEVLGVRQAFLRSLDAAGTVPAARSAGGRRLYTRRQLAFAARISFGVLVPLLANRPHSHMDAPSWP